MLLSICSVGHRRSAASSQSPGYHTLGFGEWQRSNLELTVFYFGIHFGTTAQPSKQGKAPNTRAFLDLYEYFSGNIHIPDGTTRNQCVSGVDAFANSTRTVTAGCDTQWNMDTAIPKRGLSRWRYYRLVKLTMHSSLYRICPLAYGCLQKEAAQINDVERNDWCKQEYSIQCE
jgi:hypothetical protein